ncbi:hypothetical protein D7X88_09550 [bacterium C-53]|nr:hypothetical protein [Lachnospiraceae bacterium]NBI03280.1 hypothetical protein [Lachnospiraceae bacterium]RKJ09828.1 hypothetical protein D7X88_09550 [bacterium C-53]
MQQISGMVKNFISCYLILNILIQAVPGEKYRKYVRTFGGFLMIISFLGQIPVLGRIVSQDSFGKLVQEYAKDFEEASKKTDYLGNLTVSSVLSTVQNEIKTKLNNSERLSEYTIHTVKVSICEDESSESFGEVSAIVLYMSENVERSVNISVNRIDVRQKVPQNQNEREIVLENVVAEELGVGPDVVSLHIE